MKRLFIVFLMHLITFPLFSAAEKPSRTEIVQQLFRSVEEWMGTPYVLGGMSKKGIDCSGFVVKVYEKVFGITLPRTVAYQKSEGKLVKGQLQPGDLVFFNINGKIGHVGIYVFDNKFIHAASAGPKVGIIKCSLKEKYYQQRFVFARRIVTLPPWQPVAEEQKESNHPVNKIKDKIVTFQTGAILFRGDLHDMKNSFEVNRPVFMKFSKDTTKYNRVKLVIVDLETKDQEKYILNFQKKPILFEEFEFDKGQYELQVLNFMNHLLAKQTILVK
ncbi:MAG: C40 family peptidase [Spirochaetes bacterium]|nr:C40 family peptidase [Spirochaetota bacterium]